MWDLIKQIPNGLNSRFQVQHVAFNPDIYHYYSWREQGFLCLKFPSAEHGRSLGHLVTYTSKKREESAPQSC